MDRVSFRRNIRPSEGSITQRRDAAIYQKLFRISLLYLYIYIDCIYYLKF